MKQSELIQELSIIKGYALASNEIDEGCVDSYNESLVQMIDSLISTVSWPIINDLKDPLGK